MATGAPTAMTTEARTATGLVTLTQWLSPGFPVGAFSYSHGLEWMVDSGSVTDGPTFKAMLSDILEHGAGRNDAIFLCAAYHASDTDDLHQIDEIARALAPSAERDMETALQGAAFGATVGEIWPVSCQNMTYPVAVGAAAKAMALPLHDTTLLYLHGFAANLTSAAIRLVPLGQTEGQSVLAALAPLCVTLADQAQNTTLGDLGGCSFLADIASMKHETQYTRLFRS